MVKWPTGYDLLDFTRTYNMSVYFGNTKDHPSTLDFRSFEKY